MNCDNPEYDDIVFCLDMFNIISTDFFQPLAEDLAFNGTYDPELRDIAREFLLKVLPVENQIVRPDRYFREDVSKDDIFDAWAVAFSRLAATNRHTDICKWFNKVSYYDKSKDNRLVGQNDSWNRLFYEWCKNPGNYVELPFSQTKIQQLRIELLLYRCNIAEVSPRVAIAFRGHQEDEWNVVFSKNRMIDVWIRNTMRLIYAFAKWKHIFELLSKSDLKTIEDLWQQEANNKPYTYFSLLELRDYCVKIGLIK